MAIWAQNYNNDEKSGVLNGLVSPVVLIKAFAFANDNGVFHGGKLASWMKMDQGCVMIRYRTWLTAAAMGAMLASTSALAAQDVPASSSGRAPVTETKAKNSSVEDPKGKGQIFFFRPATEEPERAPSTAIKLIDNALASYQFTPSAAVANNVKQDTSGPVFSAGVDDVFTPRHAVTSLGAASGTHFDGKGMVRFETSPKGFGVGVVSSFNLGQSVALGATGNPMLDEALRYESYELGLNLGYAGFSFDASLSKELGGLPDAPLGEAMQGFDLGLSYSGKSWSTSLSVGAYSSLAEEFLALNEAGFRSSMTAFHFGASYQPMPRLHLTGGLRYLSISGHDFYQMTSRDRQMFYLGTRFKF